MEVEHYDTPQSQPDLGMVCAATSRSLIRYQCTLASSSMSSFKVLLAILTTTSDGSVLGPCHCGLTLKTHRHNNNLEKYLLASFQLL